MNMRHCYISGVGFFCSLLLIGTSFIVMAEEQNTKLPKHHLPDGTFRNNYIPAIDKPFSDLFKWQRTRQRGAPKSFKVKPNDGRWLRDNKTESSATWVGHSTLLVQFAGTNILTDPHFFPRASPVSFAGPRRLTPPGLRLKELPHIHIVVISHNHYDHLDERSIEALYQRQKDNPPLFFVPLRQKQWFDDRGIDSVTELDWGAHANFEQWKIYAVPVQHWTARGLFDRNKVLWAGWVVEHPQFRFFFAGDTGYSKDFKDLGKRFGSFDLAAIPIGAFEPRWFMKLAHINPEEAVQIHQDIKAKRSIAIHWGTFQLADEDMDLPPKRLEQALVSAQLAKDSFVALQHGETIVLQTAESIPIEKK